MERTHFAHRPQFNSVRSQLLQIRRFFSATSHSVTIRSKAAGIEVLDVATNIAEAAQWPHPTRPFAKFLQREYHACILLAAAHALSGYISSVSIAAMGVSPEFSVSAAAVLPMLVTTELAESAWEVLVSPLEAVGRYDLARAVQTIIGEYHKRRRIAAVKERAKDLDTRYLGGLAVRLNRFVRNG